MSISIELQLAIFALDSYNRGYGSGVIDGVSVDAEGNDIDGLGRIGSQIGDATLVLDDNLQGAQDAGFYAAAYSVSSGDLAGKTVISFRGTDNLDGSRPGGNDIVNGWFAGNGQITSQLELALEFYQAVVESGVSPENIIVTGHSLGGGLAGFVSMIEGFEGHGFDHMPVGAAGEAYSADNTLSITPDYSNFNASYVTGDVPSHTSRLCEQNTRNPHCLTGADGIGSSHVFYPA